jgi:hypothetical protein
MACMAPLNTFSHDASPHSPLPLALQEFELMLDVDKLIKDLDKDFSGFINYKEFKAIFT